MTPASPLAAPSSPPQPPDVATGTPGTQPLPPRRRRVGCQAGGIVALLLVVAVGAFGVWWAARVLTPSTAASTGQSAFASAMRKAGVSAVEPASPVSLTAIKPTGSHHFDATFTGDELAALLNDFTYESASGQHFELSNVGISFEGNVVSISGMVNASGNSYSGTVSAPVAYESGRIVLSGTPSVTAEGLSIGGAQAQQATTLVLGYVNGYLDAAPGLSIESAAVTSGGVHVVGTAPDSVSY